MSVDLANDRTFAAFLRGELAFLERRRAYIRREWGNTPVGNGWRRNVLEDLDAVLERHESQVNFALAALAQEGE